MGKDWTAEEMAIIRRGIREKKTPTQIARMLPVERTLAAVECRMERVQTGDGRVRPSANELRRIRALHRAGQTAAEIGARVGRPYQTIRAILQVDLGLTPNPSKFLTKWEKSARKLDLMDLTEYREKRLMTDDQIAAIYAAHGPYRSLVFREHRL